VTVNPLSSSDLAGYCLTHPNYFQIRARINHLLDRYLSVDILSDRLTNLPTQFTQPHARPWEPIHWKAIHPNQIIGVDPNLFLLVLASSTEVEVPIRLYAQESWAYLQSLHPQMASFMGGEYQPDGSIKALGIWEKEERQHAPALSKIYQQLTGEKLHPKPNSVAGYQPKADPWLDLYQHVISRITTEWGAVSIYLWLMAHSTGALQHAIAQPLQDEVNHLAKFWGFSRWAFAESYFAQLQGSTQNLVALFQHHQGERTQGKEILIQTRAFSEVAHLVELAFTFSRVMVRLRTWNQELSSSFLNYLLGTRPLALGPSALG
jgi:hypothetical protein